jgi:hypothetical protein
MPLKFSESEKKLPLGRTIAGGGRELVRKKLKSLGKKGERERNFVRVKGKLRSENG